MKTQSILVLAMVVMLLAVSTAQATLVANVSTYAEYDTYTDSQSDISYNPAITAEAHAHTWLPGETSDYGKSDAWATIGSSVKAYSAAQGAYGGTITTYADATQTTEWQITSGTLGIGTPVSVLLDISFDGSLRSISTTIASASASLDFGNTTIYEGSGTSGYYSALDSTGAWSGDFTSSSNRFYLDTTDRISIDAEVGQTITLTLSLHTEAYVSTAMESGAFVDFSDSGFYTFVGAEDPLNPGTMLDVNFEMVPEPSTLLLLGFGTVMLRRKR